MRVGPACILALFLSAAISFAQPSWSQHYGGVAEDIGRALVQTADSGYALFGQSTSSGAGSRDCWLVRTDSVGATRWSHTYGGALDDFGYALRETADHGFILAGSTTLPGNNRNAWVARTDSLGDTLWTKALGGTGSEDVYAVVQTADGGIVCAGRSTSYTHGSEDFWLFKLSATGDSLWSRHFGGSSMDICWALTATPDGGFLLAGQTQSYGPSHSDGPISGWCARTPGATACGAATMAARAATGPTR